MDFFNSIFSFNPSQPEIDEFDFRDFGDCGEFEGIFYSEKPLEKSEDEGDGFIF